jgi:hypothetical protein
VNLIIGKLQTLGFNLIKVSRHNFDSYRTNPEPTNFNYYLQDSRENTEYESEDNNEAPYPEQIPTKSLYLMHSQYLSGITEKSDEESHITTKMYQNSCYARDRENVDSILIKQEGFVNSQSSARSSRINSRLLRYFEDSLQKEIPISLSPSAMPIENSVENISNNANNTADVMTNNYFTRSDENRANTINQSFSDTRQKDDDQTSQTHSLTIKSVQMSDKKPAHRYSSNNRLHTDTSKSDNGTPRLTYEHLEGRDDSVNSSMSRKQRYIDKFIESSRDKDGIL